MVIHQLPRTRETLWIRLLGRDSFQKRAIEEVIELPTEDTSRSRVLELLGNWKIMLDEKTEAEREEERELIMNLSPAYLKWKEETRNEGKQEGIQIGEERGIQIGEQRTKLQTARNLLSMGLDPQQIATATGLTLEQIRQL